MHQVYDRITYGIPGPTGDISPELQEAADNAVSAAATASSAKTAAQSAKAAAEAAAAAAAQSASEATSAVAAPPMTQSEAQAGTVTTSRTVSPKVMGDEIDRRIASDVIVISGKSYKRSGVVAITTPTWIKHADGVYYGAIKVKVPFTPPTGWGFVMSVCTSTGFVNGFYNNSNTEFRALTSNSAVTLTELYWQLIQIS